MADLTCTYTLAAPGGTIVFNDGSLDMHTDKYWIAAIEGLDGAELRTTVDAAPQTHGGLVHASLRGPRIIIPEGSILIQSVPWGGDCREALNIMEEDLRVAWESMTDADGTLSWTPTGMSPISMVVRAYQPKLDYSPENNYATRRFVFGLIAADPDWVVGT